MERNFVLVFVLLVSLAVSAATPHLQLDSTYLDLGVIPSDSIGEGELHFRNTGDAPLQIMQIFSECGCTVPEYSTDEVMPNSVGVIKVRFNGKNRHAGPFRKALRIRSNADNPRVVIIVKGCIDTPIPSGRASQSWKAGFPACGPVPS